MMCEVGFLGYLSLTLVGTILAYNQLLLFSCLEANS